MNSNQCWNRTNDKFTGFDGMETQRMCDEIRLTFELKYNYNIPKMMDSEDINCFMIVNEFYNKVNFHIKIILFRRIFHKKIKYIF